MKKIISISLLFIFILQALPVTVLFDNFAKSFLTAEIKDDAGKEDNGKTDEEKELKVKYPTDKYASSFRMAVIQTNWNILTAENAVILHHTEVCTPPPNKS